MTFQTVFVYTLLLIVLLGFGFIVQTRTRNNTIQCSFNHWANWLPILFFSILMGLRYDVGTDHLSYMYSYNTNIGVERWESIFREVAYWMNGHRIHYFWFFALWAFIQIFLFYYALKDEQYLIPYAAIVLIMGQYFMHWLNGIRQDTAACIFFFSIIYITDRKFIKYLLCCIVAMGFHTSAILLIPLYPILVFAKDFTFSRLFQVVLLTIAFFVALTKRDYLGELMPIIDFFANYLGYDVYSEYVLESFIEKTKAGNGMSFRLLFVLNLIIIFYSNKLKAFFQNRKITIYYNLYFWGAFFQLFFINNLVLARPFRYFRLFNLIMIAYLLYYLYTKKTNINFIVFIIVILILILLFVATIINEPFYFIWDI